MIGAMMVNPLLLIALGLGYVVCYFANREEKDMRTVGFAIGIFIILFSLLFIAYNLYSAQGRCGKMGMIRHKMVPHRAQPILPGDPGK